MTLEVPNVQPVTNSVKKSILGNVFGSVGSAIGSFASTVKLWVVIGLIVALAVVSGGFYIYYNYSQAIIVATTENLTKMTQAFEIEKASFQKEKSQNEFLLEEIKNLQIQQAQIQQENDDLRQQINSYNYNDAIINPTQVERDINNLYMSIIKKLSTVTSSSELSKENNSNE